MELRRLELNGGRVEGVERYTLTLPPTTGGYADAQIDDYGLAGGRNVYPWRAGTTLSLRARFSHEGDQLRGTAGFGFWNAPFGDPTVRRPALPQAVWFFFASPPSDLPFYVQGPGRGWFAATVDAGTPGALFTVPLAPAVLLLNQSRRLRDKLWPWVRRRLQISAAPITRPLRQWHTYSLAWQPDHCRFSVDDEVFLQTPYSPRGPLGFVCWIDNQYLVLTPRGRVRWGVLAVGEEQFLEVEALRITRQ